MLEAALGKFSRIVRDWNQSDRAFIADSWLNTLRAASLETRRADWQCWRAFHNQRIDGILDDERTRVRVVAPPDDEFTVYGFLVYRETTTPHDPGLLHMLFVKKPFRKDGMARDLLDGIDLEGMSFTEWTAEVEKWILARFEKFKGRDRWGKPIVESSLRYNPHWRMGVSR